MAKLSIALSESANSTLNMEMIVRGLIGRDVPSDASFPDDEDIALYTTLHQAIAIKHITQPMKTEKREKLA